MSLRTYSAESAYGIRPPQGPSLGVPVSAPTERMGTDTLGTGWRGLLDPDNPLFWFGVILAVTFGAVGVAGSVRLGRAKLSGELGQA